MNEAQVEALVRVRDGLRQASDAIDDLLQVQAPQNTKNDLTKLPYRIDLIPWQDKTNENGPFQLCDVETNADLVALRTFVLQHAGGGITTKDNQGSSWYVWVFPDSKTVGRKQSQFVKRRQKPS